MVIFVLIGNTNVKFAAGAGAVETLPLRDAPRALAAPLGALRGESAVLASVNPPAELEIDSICRAVGLKTLLYAGRDFPVGVELALKDPSSVGIDRVLNVKAAFRRTAAACAAVDLGTAISVSVADPLGRFVGGAILPGIGLSLRCLSERTALLPLLPPALPETPLGGDTAAAMASGCVFGAVGALREIVSRIAAAMRADLRVIITGGDAPLLASLIPQDWCVLPDLAIEGLRLAYEEAL